MEHRILTNDYWKDEAGVDQVFLQVEINDGTEVWSKAERLPETEVAQIVDDPSAVDAIAQAMAERAVIMRPKERIEEENQQAMRLEQLKADNLKMEIELEQLKAANK